MGRYSKTYSNYILRKKHQNVEEGLIFERDWVTIGSVHRLEPGKKPFFSDYNFIFTENILPFFKKKHDYGKWVAHFVYDDVKDATGEVNTVEVNRVSNDLCSFAYYGSAEDLIKGSIENIIKYFPGQIQTTDTILELPQTNGEYYNTGEVVFSNPFMLDLHTEEVLPNDYDNTLRFLTLYWKDYVVETIDGEEEIAGYEVVKNEKDVINPEQYHDAGYNFILYNNYLFQWDDCGSEGFVEVEYSETCSNFFVKCADFIKYNNNFYRWSELEGVYVEITVFEICNDNNQRIASITITTGRGNIYTIDAYKMDGETVYGSIVRGITIKPRKAVIDAYFSSLEGFEKVLLNRKSNPLYTNKLKVPYQMSNGTYVMVQRPFTWPSNGYCIDIESIAYTSFVNDLMDVGALYDETYSDCIWRCMTHESIKNFDWTYRRVYSDNDAQDNIDGGNRMMEVLHFYGRIYDNTKRYIDGIRFTNNVTYDGFDNMPDAELSDKNETKGWDVVSTIWEPYYYEETADIPQGVTVVPYPVLPVNINAESPEYISIGCGENAVYFQKRVNDPSLAFLTWGFINDNRYIVGKHNAWIHYNHNSIYVNIGCELPDGAEYVEMDYVPLIAGDGNMYILVQGNFYKKTHVCYVETRNDPMASIPDYWNYTNTYPSIPSTITSVSPQYIKVEKRNRSRYYVLTDTGFDNQNFTHEKWFNACNPNAVTPLSSDIDFNRILHLSTNRIFKTKGTRASIDMVMGLFGLGSDSNTPDYSITEFYNVTSPKKSSDIFYFYDELSEEPDNVTWDSTNTFNTLDEALINIGENSPQYIKVVSNDVEFYYVLVKDYTYEDMITELYRHKTTERVYDDIYTGTPITQTLIGNDKYVIPYYTSRRVYDGYLYFQQKGGWGKWSSDIEEKYNYSETIPYMHLVPNVESLMSIFSNQIQENDIYYVFDTSDYMDFDEDVPFNLSHFFKAYDKYNPQRFSSWKNVPMEGEIVYNVNYDKDGVTHEDYVHAKYLNDIVPTVLFNNPHTGNGEYDMGRDFIEYMKTPYKYSFEHYGFDDDKYNNIARQYSFSVNEIVAEANNEKFAKWLNTMTYYYDNGVLKGEKIPFDSSTYFLNDKLIILKNHINNNFHKKFMKDIVLKYVMQVIPSTAILVLEGFNEEMGDNLKYYTITTQPNNVDYGTTSGDGEYLDTTYAVLRAEEKEGYHFVRWEKVGSGSEEVISYEPITQVIVCGNADYIAIFEEDCMIGATCDTKCSVLLECEAVETCQTTLLCEIEEECEIHIGCTDNSDCSISTTCETIEE